MTHSIHPLWRIAQTIAVLAALAVVGLLLIRPHTGLLLTWDVAIPLIPFTLLLAPRLWRNLCPIATLSQIPIGLSARHRRSFPLNAKRGSTVISMLLLGIIVPLRLTVFNSNATALALFTVSVIVLALVGGIVFNGKSGWCSSICPVYPVERLYGQRPVLEVPHAHCPVCTGCVRSCFDLQPERSIGAITQPGARRHQPVRRPTLLGTPVGWFAAAFPGFVLGYFTTTAGASLAETYLRMAAFCIASIGALCSAELLLGARRVMLLRTSAAMAAAIYYWFTIPAIDVALFDASPQAASGSMSVAAIRSALLLVIGIWLLRAVDRSGGEIAETLPDGIA